MRYLDLINFFRNLFARLLADRGLIEKPGTIGIMFHGIAGNANC